LQKYHDTVIDAAHAIGVSPSSLSRNIIEITARKLKEFKERGLSSIKPSAIYIPSEGKGGLYDSNRYRYGRQ